MCQCSLLPDIIYYDQRPNGFEDSLVKVANGPWVELFRCSSCSQFWRIDMWDKYRIRFAVKVVSEMGWIEFDSTVLEKELMLKERGGHGEATCICINCQQPVVMGMLLCIDHLYENGNRK